MLSWVRFLTGTEHVLSGKRCWTSPGDFKKKIHQGRAVVLREKYWELLEIGLSSSMILTLETVVIREFLN
jgi:hypothetical protein